MSDFDPGIFSIPFKEVKKNAIIALNLGYILKLMERNKLKGASLLEPPTPLYDLNGEILLYEFQIAKDKINIGSILVAGNKLVGAPFTSFLITPRRWDYNEIRERVLIETNIHGAQATDVKFVAYGLSRICAMVNYLNHNNEHSSALLDLPKLNALQKGNEAFGGVESYLDHIFKPNYKKIIDNYNKISDDYNKYFNSYDMSSMAINNPEIISIPKILSEIYHEGLTDYCIHGYNHECDHLHAQERDYWCVPAVMQMILCFWRYYIDQQDIVTRFEVRKGNLPDPQKQMVMFSYYLNAGCCPTCGNANLDMFDIDEIITSESSNNYQKDKDRLISKIIEEIDNNRPCKLGGSDHAMAVFGYNTVCPIDDTVIIEVLIKIFDPFPPCQQSQIPGPAPTTPIANAGGTIFWHPAHLIKEPNIITIKRK